MRELYRRWRLVFGDDEVTTTELREAIDHDDATRPPPIDLVYGAEQLERAAELSSRLAGSAEHVARLRRVGEWLRAQAHLHEAELGSSSPSLRP